MWRYTHGLPDLSEPPAPTPQANRIRAAEVLQAVRQSGRDLLTEFESKQILAAYGIPVVETRVAQTEDDAVKLAGGFAGPVVLKVYSQTITHKTDIGGVKLDLRSPAEVLQAYRAIQKSVSDHGGPKGFLGVTVEPMIPPDGYELILGSSTDPQFGPVLLFGAGGQLVEVLKDRALALPPLDAALARHLMEQTRIYTALKGVRGRPPVDLKALENILVRFSALIVEQPSIREVDINPLTASASGVLALDARILLQKP
jgi:acetyltransferase